MVVRLIDQLPIVFEEGYQDQSTRLEGMVSALCISYQDLALLKNYPCFHPCLQISVVGNSGRPKTNVGG
jgi:hypothetical protein